MVTLTISLDNSYCKAYRLPEELFWSRLIESKASFKWLKKLAEATTPMMVINSMCCADLSTTIC